MARRRRKHHEEHANHEAWAIPYGDLVTLLLAACSQQAQKIYGLSITCAKNNFSLVVTAFAQELNVTEAVVQAAALERRGEQLLLQILLAAEWHVEHAELLCLR